MNENKNSEYKPGMWIRYNDGRQGHTDARAEVQAVRASGMMVQFTDRLDGTWIAFNQPEWMKFITVIK